MKLAAAPSTASPPQLRRLKVLLTADPELPVPPPHYGGIERIVDLVAVELAKRGHEVTLLAHPESTTPVRRLAWPGRSSRSTTDTVRNALFLSRAVLGGGIDLMHSFSRLAYLAPLLAGNLPKVMTYQREISSRTTGLAHRIARDSLGFTAVSRQMITPGLRGRWRHVPNGLNIERYAFAPSVATDAPLMFLGRIEAIKGPDLAIEAARRAGRRLILAGNVPGEHRGWFDAAIAPHIDGDQVRYVGPVDDARKAELLGRCAALLMPIRWDEPFGIVMIEAMACGAPVIALRRGAAPEVVGHGETGFVVETLEEMVGAIARLDEIDRAACRARVERLYGAAPVVDGYLAIYAEMLVARGGRT